MCMRSMVASLLLLCASVLADDEPVRFTVSDSATMPLVDLQSGKPTDGTLYHLYLRIAEKLGRKPELLVTSRTRTQPLLAEDQVDANCYMNPAWLSEDNASYRWSVSFMTLRTVLVARIDTPRVCLVHLKAERIGTVLGYHYPEAARQFSNGDLIRDNARTESQVLEKLKAGRYRYAIATETAVNWFNRSRPANQQLQIIEPLAEFPVHCIVRSDADATAHEILNALKQMKVDGEFEVIQARYR